MIMIMVFQILGGLAAIFVTWAGTFDDGFAEGNETTNPKLPALVPALLPVVPTGYDSNALMLQAFINEIVCTFLFISVILMVKGKYTAGDRKGVSAAICVVATLLCVISGTNKLGACFNPAVGVSLTVNQLIRISTDSKYYEYVWVYTLGPYIGGLLAGFFHLIHKKFHEPDDAGHVLPEQREHLIHK